jgi:hypothetical protein
MVTRTHPIPAAARPGEGLPPVGRWLALAVLCVSLLMVTLDNTVLNVALPTLVRDLHATTTELQRIVAAVGCLIALIALPSRDRSGDVPAAEDALGDGRRADDGEQPQEHR